MDSNDNCNKNRDIITDRVVSVAERVGLVARLFGRHFPLRLEPAIYDFASMLAARYDGGHWAFHALSNGGFFMAPEGEGFDVVCENGFEGRLGAEAFGITVCLYAYSNLSFGGDSMAALCGEHYHKLRDFTLGHVQSAAILSACD